MDAGTFLSVLGAFLFALSWVNIFLAIGAVYLIYLLYRMNVGSGSFNIEDLFLDREKNADLYKLVVAVMSCLTVWTVVTLVNNGDPVETLLLGALTIFVGGRAANAIWGSKNDTTVVETKTKAEVAATPATATAPAKAASTTESATRTVTSAASAPLDATTEPVPVVVVQGVEGPVPVVVKDKGGSP